MKRLISAFRISGICAAYVAAAGFSPLMAAAYDPGYAPYGRIGDRTPVVTNAWDAVSNKTHSLIEKVAPVPGAYATVSNAAMNALSRAEAKAGFTAWTFEGDGDFFNVLSGPEYVGSNRWELLVKPQSVNQETWTADGGQDALSLAFSGGIIVASRVRLPTISITNGLVGVSSLTNYVCDIVTNEVQYDWVCVPEGCFLDGRFAKYDLIYDDDFGFWTAYCDGGTASKYDVVAGEDAKHLQFTLYDEYGGGTLVADRRLKNALGLARLSDLDGRTTVDDVCNIVTNEVVVGWSEVWDLEVNLPDVAYANIDEMSWWPDDDSEYSGPGYWQLVVRWRYEGEPEDEPLNEIIRDYSTARLDELTEVSVDGGDFILRRRPTGTRNALGLARLSDLSSSSDSLTAAMSAEVTSATSAIATASSKIYARMDGVSNGRRFKEAFGKQGNKHRGSGFRYVDEYYFGGCFGVDYGTSRLDDESHFSLWTAGLYDDDNDTNKYFSVYSKLPVSMRDGSITGRDPYVYSPGLLLPGDYGQIPWFSLIRAVDAYGRVGSVFSQSENYILHGWSADEDAELRQHHPTVAYVNSAVDWVTNLVAKRVTAHAAVSASNLLDRDGGPVDADTIQERAAQQTATSTVPLYAYSAWQTDWPDDDEAQPTMPVWTNGAWAVWVKDPHMTDGPFTVQGSESDTNLLYTLYGYATRFWRSAAIVAGRNAYGLARLSDLDAATNELEESLSALNISPVELPEGMAGRGVTFTDGYGEDQNVAVSIGRNARAAVDPSSLGAVNGSTVLRSVSVAIGAESNALDASKPTSSQGIAIGWHAQARSSNAIAIGSGAQHPGETAETGNATVASASTSIAAGYDAKATGTSAIAIGKSAKAKAQNAVQLGTGVNTDANTLKFMGHTLIDALGRIPRERFAEAFSSAVMDGLERVVSPGKMNPVSGKEEVIEPMLNSLSEVVWEKDENGVYSAGGEIGIEPPLGSRNYDILIHDIPAFVGVTNGVPYSMPPEENCIVDFAELLSQGYSVSCAVSPPCGWTNGRYAVLTNAPCVLKVREPSHRRVVVAIKPWNILEDL